MAPLNGIATGAGDDGTTGLPGGAAPLSKDDSLIEAIGELDELTAVLGLARAEAYGELERRLWRVQNLAGALATLVARSLREPVHADATPDVSELEGEGEKLLSRLRMPQGFVVPGANRLQAQLHHARAVCRRAERRLVAAAAAHREAGIERLFPLVNRLSDYLFALALSADPEAGRTDTA
jgi:cob(I)alamin adenosyltransferase